MILATVNFIKKHVFFYEEIPQERKKAFASYSRGMCFCGGFFFSAYGCVRKMLLTYHACACICGEYFLNEGSWWYRYVNLYTCFIDIKCGALPTVHCGHYTGTSHAMGQTWHLQCDPGCHLVGTGELTCIGVPDPFHHVAIWDAFQGSSKCEKSKPLSPKISEVLYYFFPSSCLLILKKNANLIFNENSRHKITHTHN